MIIGENAAGKTSILEALHLLSTGKSFRATKVEEMIRFGAELARLQVISSGEEDETEQVEAVLTRGLVQGKRTPPTLFSLNGARKRKKRCGGASLNHHL